MTEDFIDVDYEEIPSDNDDSGNKNPDITINADPVSAAISGLCSVVNNVTNAAKEYGICKQQEKTKREEIKAQMKIEIERIHAEKEWCLKVLDEQHELKMFQVQAFYQQCKKTLDDASDAVHDAIEIAKESKDFSDVIALLEMEKNISKDNSEAQLKFLEMLGNPRLAIGGNKGLLEIQ